MRSVALFLFSLWFVLPVRAEQAGTGLQISVAGDTIGQFGTEGPEGATNRINVREAEFLFYAPVDHLFDAQLSFAAHNEAGFFVAELHELFVETTRIVPRSRIRLGQYFLQFGRLNQIHRHDWAFISTPKVHRDFFDEEALLDTGLQYTYLLPTSFFLEFTAGITNGWTYGHTHTAGAKPVTPLHYARLATYTDLPWDGGLQAGLNYVGRKDNGGTSTSLYGLDLVAKWRELRNFKWLFQSEIWYRTTVPAGGVSSNDFGFYFYPQYYLGSNLSLGARFDYLTRLDQKDAFGAKFANYYFAVEPTLMWKPSEFTTLRLAYAYRGQSEQGTFVSNDRVVLLQSVFIIGAHPAHDF